MSKYLWIGNICIPFLSLLLVILLNIDPSFSKEYYAFCSIYGVSTLAFNTLDEHYSVSVQSAFTDYGILLFLSGFTILLPVYNPLDIVPLLQFTVQVIL